MKLIVILLCAFCSIPSFANNPWDSFLINNKKVSVNFKNQSAHTVNSWLTQVTGIPILMDPSFNKPITISSPSKIDLSQCFQMYNQILSFYNYEITKENKWLVIKPIIKNSEPVKDIDISSSNKEQLTEIRIIKLKNNNSDAVAKLINELFMPTLKIEDFIGRINPNDTIRPSRQN